MRKSKLDKLIQTKKDKKELNYSVLDKAKEALSEQKRLKKSRTSFQWKGFAKILVPACCVLIIVIVACVVFYHPAEDDSSLPPVIDAPKPDEKPDDSDEKHFSSSENNQRNIQSIESFNKEKNISLRYFSLENIEETIIIHEDVENTKDKDVLLWQRILLLETYEEIKMYIELQGGYIFDFLDRFENLEQKLEIKGTVVNYDTLFDEEQYLFCTRTSFEIGGFKYKVEFFLEDQEQWCSYLEEIL